MFKTFVLIATVAALFVACSSEAPDSMETAQPNAANDQEMLDAAAAEEEAVVAPITPTEEVVVGETPATTAVGTEVPMEATEATEPK
ncbi:MAG: hypothetical protein M3R08_05170 [Bacteroidota bacterium]|nr:hypothetical protein [Bacteroidota bacterium]